MFSVTQSTTTNDSELSIIKLFHLYLAYRSFTIQRLVQSCAEHSISYPFSCSVNKMHIAIEAHKKAEYARIIGKIVRSLHEKPVNDDVISVIQMFLPHYEIFYRKKLLQLTWDRVESDKGAAIMRDKMIHLCMDYRTGNGRLPVLIREHGYFLTTLPLNTLASVKNIKILSAWMNTLGYRFPSHCEGCISQAKDMTTETFAKLRNNGYRLKEYEYHIRKPKITGVRRSRPFARSNMNRTECKICHVATKTYGCLKGITNRH